MWVEVRIFEHVPIIKQQQKQWKMNRQVKEAEIDYQFDGNGASSLKDKSNMEETER